MIAVLIPRQILTDLCARAIPSQPTNETGGILLGFRKALGLQITNTTYAQCRDFASPSLFKRSKHGHSEIAAELWTRSRGTIDWVGEWHTHPNGIASPSHIDVRSWRFLVSQVDKPMVFIISNGKRVYVGLQEPTGSLVRKMTIQEMDGDSILFI